MMWLGHNYELWSCWLGMDTRLMITVLVMADSPILIEVNFSSYPP